MATQPIGPVKPLASYSDEELYRLLKRAVNERITSGDIPSLLVELYERGTWRSIPRKGGVLTFPSFRVFVTASPDGLGIDPGVVMLMARRAGLPREESVLAKAFADDPGGRPSEDKHHSNIIGLAQGTTRPYALRRLERARGDLHARVLAGQLSPHAAMVEAGFRHPTLTIQGDDVHRAVAKLVAHYGLDAVRDAVSDLLQNR